MPIYPKCFPIHGGKKKYVEKFCPQSLFQCIYDSSVEMHSTRIGLVVQRNLEIFLTPNWRALSQDIFIHEKTLYYTSHAPVTHVHAHCVNSCAMHICADTYTKDYDCAWINMSLKISAHLAVNKVQYCSLPSLCIFC